MKNRRDCAIDQRFPNPFDVTGITFVSSDNYVDNHTEILILDAEEAYSSSVDVSASASFGFGMFSGSADFEMTENAATDINTLRVIVRVKALAGVNQVSLDKKKELKFSAEALSILTTPGIGLGEFRKKYGDSFISGVVYGGEFVFMATITCQNEEVKRSIKTSISTKAPFDSSVNGSGALSEAFKKSGATTVIVQRTLGSELAPASNGVDDVLKFAASFQTTLKPSGDGTAKGNPLRYLVTGYEDLENCPTEYHPRSDEEEDALRELANLYLAYVGIYNKLQLIQGAPYAFDLSSYSSDALANQIKDCSAAKDAAKKAASDNEGFWRLSDVLTKENALNGKPLPDPKDMLEKLPAPLDCYFDISPSPNPDGLPSTAELRYRTADGTPWKACIINGLFRHTPLPGGPSHTEAYIDYIYQPKGAARAYLSGSVKDNNMLRHFIPPDSHDPYSVSNGIDFLDENGVRRFAEIKIFGQ